ncbi:phosphatidylserine decarboxylase [Capronia coronata CBS 617.96]|uniref:Phosphatidylserine decarboxylase n=1 Tax=Capronia coronata CBS 617.96 TaxID=1182541 RepID=W9YKP8_9EURO|nr:phosphatidylserine decarboxylase [Capronia coronata CBS 617.96]EXJ90260.1 phosphatidylserine decarboxylase [Capronia coronata CBS 617.96]
MSIESHRAPFPRHRLGGWLPADRQRLIKWTRGLVKKVNDDPQPLNDALQQFKAFIEGDPTVRQLFTLMFEQVPAIPPYNQDPTGKPEIRNYDEMLAVFNLLMTQGPHWIYNTEGQKGLIGFPINAVLDWPMGTVAGYAAFLRPDINAQFKDVLDAWAKYLASPDSASVLSSDLEGWFCPEALNVMAEVASEADPSHPVTFEEAFVCDPSKPAYGYTSWDDFFTRIFREGRRPVEYPEESIVIANACESTPYRIARNVKAMDKFWIKEQPYSLKDMLGGSELTDQFVDGTVYQAFLSALSYHRWHSPVTGRVEKIMQLPGSYYAENYWEGFANPNVSVGPDPAAPNNSQGYICAIATRVAVFIQADDPTIGLMAFLAVGMAEVSSCEVFVKEGATLKKGDDLGTFHFGGSTHCLIFRPEVNVKFTPQEPFKQINVPVRSAIGFVVKPE